MTELPKGTGLDKSVGYKHSLNRNSESLYELSAMNIFWQVWQKLSVNGMNVIRMIPLIEEINLSLEQYYEYRSLQALGNRKKC